MTCLEIEHLNARLELLADRFPASRAEQLDAVSRLYNRTLGPVVAVNYLRPDLLDLALFSAYCHHVPLEGLLRDLGIRAAPHIRSLAGGGKGGTRADAVLGALGEMAERLLGTLHWTSAADRVRHATHDELAREGLRALGPDELPIFAPEQYAGPGFEFAPWRGDTPLGWVEGHDLLDGAPVLVPAQLVLMYYRRHRREPAIGYATTAGGAFHTSRARAILHGLHEVIERDALNVTWYCRLPPRRARVDLTAFARDHLGIGRPRMATPYIPTIDILTLELDTPVAVLAAIAVDGSRDERAFLGGSGAASRREDALAQAILEVGQCQTAFHFDNPFGRSPIDADTPLSHVVEFFDAPLYFGHLRNLSRARWYTASPEVVPWEAVRSTSYASTADEYEDTLRWLRSSELRPVVLDFDDACWPGVSLTKVFVPQLSQACPPHRPPLGHPRFSELPRALGLAARRLEFHDLCTDPIPFA